MALIQCRRCHGEREGFAEAPLPGPLGLEVLTHACPGCFRDWMGQEVMIINEYRLDLAVPRNQDLLNEEMSRFLDLPSAAAQGGDAG